MDVEVTQENLARALSMVGRVANAKAGLPILNNILLRTDGNQVLIAATDLEVAATQRIGAKIATPGSITVPARLISEFISNLPKGTIKLTVRNDILSIKSSVSSSTINGLKDEEFPELPVIDESQAVSYTIENSLLKDAFEQTIITSSNDATRPVLTGVFWHTFEKYLYLAATDGYRLSERQVMPIETDIQAIVPTTTMQEVLRTLQDDTESVDVLFDDTQVRFRIGENEITSRLIDGNFPDYRQLIPATNVTTLTVSTDELKRVVKIAALFARDVGGSITLSADADKNELEIRSIASELGENKSIVSAETSGETASISLNSRYLREALNVVSTKEISFSFSGKIAPSLLEPVEKKQTYKHIIMPIKS